MRRRTFILEGMGARRIQRKKTFSSVLTSCLFLPSPLQQLPPQKKKGGARPLFSARSGRRGVGYKKTSERRPLFLLFSEVRNAPVGAPHLFAWSFLFGSVRVCSGCHFRRNESAMRRQCLRDGFFAALTFRFPLFFFARFSLPALVSVFEGACDAFRASQFLLPGLSH